MLRLGLVVVVTAAIGLAQPRMDVRSKDGTNIAVIKIGAGPAMLMVHGSASASLSWALTFQGLAPHFTIYAMDRRGRAPSGDNAKYSAQTEIDDLTAVIDAIHEPVVLVAHSYGAFIAVAGLDQLKNVSRLVLYEPPVSTAPLPGHDKLLVDLKRAWEAGDRETVATRFIQEIMGQPAYTAMHASPVWPNLLAQAGTLPREVQAVNDFKPSAAQLGKWKIPTTMFLGSTSPGYMRDGATFVCKSLANCKLEILEGQGHMAAQRAPELFVTKLLAAVGAP